MYSGSVVIDSYAVVNDSCNVEHDVSLLARGMYFPGCFKVGNL